jgi:hypothetical protein
MVSLLNEQDAAQCRKISASGLAAPFVAYAKSKRLIRKRQRNDAVAIALDDSLNRAPTLVVRFAVTFACNAIFWFACSAACSAAWRKLRGKHQV